MIVTIDKKEVIQTDRPIEIQIDGTKYTLRETVDCKLCINKSDGDDGPLMVFPRYANEIDIL